MNFTTSVVTFIVTLHDTLQVAKGASDGHKGEKEGKVL